MTALIVSQQGIRRSQLIRRPTRRPRVQITFESFDAALEFLSECRLRLTVSRGPEDGFTDEVDYFLTPIGKDGAQLGFTERNGTTVVHAIDRRAGVTHTTIVKSNGEVARLRGAIHAAAKSH